MFGESDALPGLIVDRYGDVAVAQISTAGMERVRDDVVSVLRSELGFRTVVLRNDTPARTLEGLESETEVVGEPIGEHAACRPRAHDDVVEGVDVSFPS